MGQRYLTFCLIGLILSGLLAATARADRPAEGPKGLSTRTTASQGSTPPRVCHLYFADADYRHLVAEQRLIPSGPTSEAVALAIVKALIEGPQEGHQRTLPVDTSVNALFITSDGTAYLDLAEGIAATHPGGGYTELLTLFSLVNSLTLNLETVKRVKILIDGSESPTLAGHLDLKQPYKADLLLVR